MLKTCECSMSALTTLTVVCLQPGRKAAQSYHTYQCYCFSIKTKEDLNIIKLCCVLLNQCAAQMFSSDTVSAVTLVHWSGSKSRKSKTKRNLKKQIGLLVIDI